MKNLLIVLMLLGLVGCESKVEAPKPKIYRLVVFGLVGGTEAQQLDFKVSNPKVVEGGVLCFTNPEGKAPMCVKATSFLLVELTAEQAESDAE